MTPISDDAVAVVGTACRLPSGIHHLDDLWAVLAAGADLVGEVPPDRFPTADFVDTHRRPGQSYTAAGGFLDDVAGFDTTYFTAISPREAAQMDPQQRLLLEMAVEVLDDAGTDAARLEGSDTAVFVGCSSLDYGQLQSKSPESGNAYTVSGTAGAIAANRLSHYFDWHGQSVMVDTACSSALTAVHQACEHLRNGHARVAVAGGINVLLNPHLYAGFCNASMLSPTGRCRPFSAEADGFARAEGGGLVLLKRLADARADGDHVHAVILSSGTNNDGRTPGLALPSSVAQQALLRQVYARAGLVPDDVAYLEAHGTGTRAGDPLEVEAVGRALAVGRDRGPLPIGSVKSNLGHMEAAAGMAGLFKAMLVLRHQRIPATLHAERLNPEIAFDDLNVRPVVRPEPLDSSGTAVAGVNSFGFGGANAHVVIAAAPAAPADESLPGPSPEAALPVVVSARTPVALKRACEQMAEYLQFTEDGLYDIAYTATLRRTRHEHAACVWAADPSQAADAFLRLAGGETPGAATTAVRAAPGRVAFVFDGNGSQWAGMGADLMTEPVFAAAVDEVDTCLRPHLRWSVAERLAGGSPDLERTEVAQPLLFAVQVGVVRLLEAAGIEPDAVVGHSVGEIAAAYVAGCLDLEEACRVVAVRSRAQAATAGSGRMAAVGLGVGEVTKELAAFEGRLEIAGVNSPTDVTLAGDPVALTELGEQLTARGVFFRLLDLDYAFHSRHMDPVRGDVTGPLSTLRPRPGRLAFASTVTGAVSAGPRLDAGYWWRNVREPVLFADAVRALADLGCTSFVEVGPHPVLATYLKRLLPARAGAHATLRRDTDGPTAVRRAAAAVIAAGVRPGARCFPRPGTVVSLPGYPWQRERHWNGAPDWWASVPQDRTVVHPLLGRRAAVAEPTWHQQLTLGRLPWLTDHRLDTDVVMPATTYLEAALAAGRAGLGARCEVTDLTLLKPLTLPRADDPTPVSVQTSLSVEDGVVLVASRRDASAPWTPHARGRVRRHTEPEPAPITAPGGGTAVDAAVYYERIARAGLHYGPAFQVLTALRVSDSWVTATYELPAAAAEDGHGFEAHPVISDGALHATAPLLAPVADGRAFLPAAVERARVWHQPPARGRIHVRLRHLTGSDAVVDVTVSLEDGTVAAELSGCRLRALGAKDGVQELATVLRHAPLPGGWPAAHSTVPLPGPETLTAATAAARAAFEADQTDDYPRFAAMAKTTAGHYAAAAFAALLPGTGPFSLDDLLDAGLRPNYAPYARLLAGLAAKAGLLRPTSGGERWEFTGVAAAAEAQTRRWAERCPQWITAIALSAHCGTHLTDVLTGRTDAREVLFNEADRHLAEAFHADTPQMRAHGHYARLVIEEALGTWPAGRPLRVLEVGAGTGGLTAALLPVLPPHLTSYTFTDVTPASLPRAQARFADHDYLDYRVLDLDRDPAEQGFAPGSYDLIVAANVLHATADLRATCTRLAGLLDSGGQLLALESHDEEILGPCFGLLPEYWSFTDGQLRTSPLLPRAAWPPLLSDCGFDAVADIGSERPETARDHSLLVARRSVVPRARPIPAPPAPEETPSRADDPWLVVTDTAGQSLAEALADDLRAAGAHVIGTRVSDAWNRGIGDFTGQVPSRVLLLFGTEQERSDADLVTEAAGVVKAAAVALAAAGHADPQLWLVTPPTGLHPAPADTGGLPWAAALWGVGRVAANEHPILTVRRVSVSSSGDLAQDAARLTAELLAPARSGAPGEEDETVLDGHGRFVPRVRPLPPATRQAHRDDTYRLRLHRPGRGHRLTWTPAEPEEPGPGEVVLRVKAAALNYRDVMLAEGSLPPDAEPATPTGPLLGLECAGIVTATGPDVTEWSVGDRLFALARGALGSHARVRAELAGRIPDHMTFEQAATLPTVFLTVQHSLETLAHLRAGETVLVHGGAGGIGLAALAYARHVGARVIATAGTPAKRDLLRTLGAEAVFNSRDLSFAHQVRDATAGRGVDVVLNSLAGEAVARSLECLAPGGRFVELGKRDIYANAPLLLRPFRDNLAYYGVDLTRLIADAPEVAAAAFRTVSERVAAGVYRVLPHQSHPAGRIEDAFSALRHSRHLGKIVISFTDSMPVVIDQPEPAVRLDPDGTYLITGGLSGLGAATARHLADRGARHLALLSRRGLRAPEAAGLVADLEKAGTTVGVYGADVTEPEAVEAVLAEADQLRRPVRGIVHAAMHLDDAPLSDLTAERFANVLTPKVRGVSVLHDLTRDRALDFFVVYSSVAALIGNQHQAPYAAANLYLEALARQRRDHGRPGLALAWGGISETGYVARTQMADTIARSGMGLISPATALAAFDRHLHRAYGQAVIGVMDWDRLPGLLPALSVARFTAQLAHTNPRASRVQADDLRKRLKSAESDQARLDLVTEIVVDATARVLQTATDRVSPTANLADLGLDSLMGAELSVSLQQTFHCELSMMELMAAATLDGIAHRIHRTLHR
ncbi:type I polyketide synthase [Streptomyces sp. CNQ085]|uniref:type I polyketide synthase n=1 Tax=Streptomyces sp. CNQ085 TaxID=2886944 RepID=UPI001F5069E5|nr:type I polyketide synthase [Streptomyces sp. CNQ085]MCI0384154.1 SDR family NAD(P)-dependent oxidoreductase [Streptomyces sp. CNQ085]